MPHSNLFFLSTRLGVEPLGAGDAALGYASLSYDWTLLIVKVNAGPQFPSATEAYLGFRSVDLAVLFNDGRHHALPVAAEKLDRNYYTDFARHPVVLFESAHEIKRCLLDRARYPYEQHLYRYAPPGGLQPFVIEAPKAAEE
ncbi:MAG TPA: hypothetical protein VH105_00685 [Burkholderiales bacterium]|nr:hypothetical protein [Burkholderiales bacterium]